MKIGFFGMSHLGLNYLAASAARGFKVVGYDTNNSLIKSLNLGNKIFDEPNLFSRIKKDKKKICFTSELENLKDCSLIFISSDVPTNHRGQSDLSFIKRNIKVLEKKFSNKNLIVMSQVHPGFTEHLNWKKNKLFYQVETLIFGRAFIRAFRPERIILGVSDTNKKIDKEILNYYKKFNCPLIKTNFRTSELIKIAINLFLISSITTTNVLSNICKKIGAKWSDIEYSLRLDKRIGKYAYLKPGLGISGGNLERDLANVINISKKYKINYSLFNLWKKNSSYQKKWILRIFEKHTKIFKLKKLGILGLSYKENTDSIKNSPSVNLINNLKKIQLYAYDPAIKKIKNNNVTLCKSSQEVIKKTNIIFIMTPWKEFKSLNKNIFYKNKIRLIVDPFGLMISSSSFFNKKKIKYFSLR
jgi:UDPglucose 6-dehydrogenase